MKKHTFIHTGELKALGLWETPVEGWKGGLEVIVFLPEANIIHLLCDLLAPE